MKLSIIVLSFNTKNLTLKCLKSLVSQYKEYLESGDLEIILADNASKDGTAKEVLNMKNKVLSMKFIQNDKNYGFSKGNNIAAKEASGEHLLFLNTDTEIKDKGFLEMAKFLSDNKNVGILGGRLLNSDGGVQKSAGNFYNLFNLFFVLIGGERVGMVRKAPKKIQAVDWVSGAALMIRADLFRKLKGFDEKIFMYMEDVDLCFRAKEIGFKTYFYSNIKLVHKEHGSSNRTFAINQIYQGLLYFYKKHKPYWQYFVVKGLLIGKALIAVTIGSLMNNNYLKKTYGQALRLAV